MDFRIYINIDLEKPTKINRIIFYLFQLVVDDLQ